MPPQKTITLSIAWVLWLPASFALSLLITLLSEKLHWIENGEFGFISAIGILIVTTLCAGIALFVTTIVALTRRSRS